MDNLNNFIAKFISWIDQLFSFFSFYTAKYSKLLVYGLLIFLLGKRLLKMELKYNRNS